MLGRLSGQLASDGYLVLGAAETTTGLSSDFMPVPERHHGIFCFTPAAAERAEEAASKRRHLKIDNIDKSANGPSSGGGGPIADGTGGGGLPAVSVADGKRRALDLDRETADLLEARATARGLSVAKLLAEFALSGESGPQDWLARDLKTPAG